MNRKLMVLIFVLAMLLILGSVALAQSDTFVFGVVLVGPQKDGGWSQAHVDGGKYVEAHLPGTKMILFESLNPADNPQASLQGVVSAMVSEGAKLIFTTSDEFKDDTTKVAPQFPDVIFVNISGDDSATGKAPPNEGNFDGQLLISREIAGCAAAMKTKTGKIGMVGPLINYETQRDQSSAYLGARYCWENYRHENPSKLTFEVIWIGFWFNIPGVTLDPTEVTNQFFDQGFDVVISGIDTLEALQVTQTRHKEGADVYFVGTDNNTVCENADPAEVCLGTQYYNWGPSFLKTVKAVEDGTWKQSFDWNPPDWNDINNLDTTAVGFVYGKGLDDKQKSAIDNFIKKISADATDPANQNIIPLWKGPLYYQDGTLAAADGEYLPAFQLQSNGPSVWYTPQLLQGMIGKSK